MFKIKNKKYETLKKFHNNNNNKFKKINYFF